MTDKNTEAEARAAMQAIRTPELDAFRRQVQTFKTSELLMYLIGPRALNSFFGDTAVTKAALLAVADELDRRMPVAA